MEIDMTFEANDEDYRILKEVWSNIIRSWMNVEQIRKIEINKRIFYVQEKAQYLYWKIHNEGDIVSKDKCREMGVAGGMDDAEFDEAFNVLISMKLIIDSNGAIRTHIMGDLEDDNQKKMYGGR